MARRTQQLPSRPERDPLEAVIAAAAGYVHPTDDLRPRVLEAARDQHRRRRGQQRLLAAAAAVAGVLILATSAWLGSEPDARRNIVPVAAAELQQRALQISGQSGVDPAWGLYEVVVELRHDQANCLNASRNGTQKE